MVVFLLVIVFIIVPIVELAAIIWVGTQIGVLPTIAILIIDSLVGATQTGVPPPSATMILAPLGAAILMPHRGRAAGRRLNAPPQERRPPAKEVVDGALVIFGGALLLTPGFVTDILGIFLLVPPT